MSTQSRSNVARMGRLVLLLIVVMCSGMLLAVGQSDVLFADSQFALMRFHTDGSVDDSFGGNGRVLTDSSQAASEWATAIAITDNGKIIAAGTAYTYSSRYTFALARYNANGSLDTSFGQDGFVFTDVEATYDEGIEDVTIAQNGKIVVAGGGYGFSGLGTTFVVARYNTDGSLDTTFGGDGRVVTDFTASDAEYAYAVDVDGNGQIVAAGWAIVNGSQMFALARYNADGSLDATFQGGGADPGKVLTDFGSTVEEYATAMRVGNDGKIVVGGAGRNLDVGWVFALARYNADGSLDTSFDEDGKVLTEISATTDEYITDIALPGGGEIIASGYGFDPNVGGNVFALARYNINGSLDTSFDEDGKVLTDFGSSANESASAVSVDRNGRIVAVGTGVHEGGYVFALARYNADGSLDGTFVGGGNAQGKITAGFPTTSDEAAWDMAFDSNGNIIVVGGAGTLAQ